MQEYKYIFLYPAQLLLLNFRCVAPLYLISICCTWPQSHWLRKT